VRDERSSPTISIVQTEPLTVAGLAGPVVVTTNSFTGRNTVTVGGQPAALIARRRYALPAANGRTVEGTVSARFFDPYPTLELNGVRHRTGPEVPVALRILALVPIALAGLGGLVGGLIGALGMIVNVVVLRRQLPGYAKALLMVAVLVATVVVWLVVAGAIGVALKAGQS